MKINLNGFATMLTAVFITLKLTNIITWSWLWVLSPVWISIGLFVITFLMILLLIGVGLYDRTD